MRRIAVVVAAAGALVWGSAGPAAAVTTSGRTCTIVGTAGNDRLIGTAGNDVICGLGGNDYLDGRGGNDWLAGGDGYDDMRGGTGADTFSGGAGGDFASWADHTTGVVVTLDGLANDGTGAERDRVLTDVEHVEGGRGNDRLTGDARDNLLGGGPGNDVFDGGRGRDGVYGEGGYDVIDYSRRTLPVRVTLSNNTPYNDGEGLEGDSLYDIHGVYGGRGSDTLVGSTYADLLAGGPGDDSLQGLAGGDALYGEDGRDTVTYSEKTTPVSVTIDDLDNDGTTGETDYVDNDVEVVVGGRVNDVLVGDAGDQVLDGGPGNDALRGLGGNDRLLGGQGDDTLEGGIGWDLLGGSEGTDVFDGGPGYNVCDHAENETVASCTAFGSEQVMVEGGQLLVGTLLNPDGTPAGGRPLAFDGFEQTTAENGSFVGLVNRYGSTLDLPLPLTSSRHALLRGGLKVSSLTQATFTLPALGTTTIHVEDAQGAPIEGATVTPPSSAPWLQVPVAPGFPAFGFSETPVGGVTDAAGDLSFPSYAPSLGSVRVTAPVRPVVGAVFSEAVELVPADRRVVRVLELRPSTVSGTVLDQGGAPISGATVNLPSLPQSTPVVTGPDGSFSGSAARTGGVLGLTVPATADHPGVETAVPFATTTDRSVALRLPAPTTLRVRAVDLQGNPLSGAVVTGGGFTHGLALGGDAPTQSATLTLGPITTGADGWAEVPVYPASSRQLRVVWTGPDGVRHARLTDDVTSSVLTLALDTRSVAVTGRVLDSAGRPVNGVEVGLQSNGEVQTGTGDPDFAVRTTPGHVGLRLTVKDQPGLPSEFTLRAQLTLSADRATVFALPTPRSTTLRVIDSNGAPVSGAVADGWGTTTVSLPGYGDLPGDQRLTCTTDAQGTCRLPVWSGTVGLTVKAGALTSYVSVGGDQTVVLRLTGVP